MLLNVSFERKKGTIVSRGGRSGRNANTRNNSRGDAVFNNDYKGKKHAENQRSIVRDDSLSNGPSDYYKKLQHH